jgi:FkbM family methyltransferase
MSAMKQIKIAIIDVIGLPYDGTTLYKKGIGGSESSIISVSRELAKLGFSVTVFNDNNKEEAVEGIYDQVEYCEIRRLKEREFDFDIVISQRTVIPFTPSHLYDQVKQPPPRDHDFDTWRQVQRPGQLKILWMQDTFLWGDHILEDLVAKGYINEIFTLSDWHTTYITNNQHGPRRNFEVLKNKIFQTRNAMNRWIEWVDVKAKDPFQFVYNASVTKGMVPLLEHIWPRVKQIIPQAKLKIIGGYYQFPNEPLNEAGHTVLRLQEMYKNDPTVEFTGIIPQPQIAEIVAKSSYMIYPGAFPETSGIATLESINYNTPVIGTRFGAMEETATEDASYFIDYAVVPNGLFPNIDPGQQFDKFTKLVIDIVNNPYLHQQKQYACNAVKDVSTWDTVALQWKQHFYSKLNQTMSKEEKDRVDWINYRVHKVFGRRFMNPEEVVVPKITVDSYPEKTKTRLAIVDIPGMSYDGGTLDRRGLGGSESAVILVAKELVKIGFEVTVFNGCNEDDSNPGTYDNVVYRPISDIEHDPCNFDVVISSRTVMPFVTEQFYSLKINTARQYPYEMFKRLRENAKFKVFWMHDTFSWGDDTIEDLVTAGVVDEIWCLSDFHTNYVMNCNHGRPRNYEVLRNHMWITRNGIRKYFDSVDLDKKDHNLFFFNANMSKGLRTLLHVVWPRVKQSIPKARLKVIGGFYKLGNAFSGDDQEKHFRDLVGDAINDSSIEFTGVISQQRVAEICAESSYFIYPAELPETYGISTLESLYANTPLITNRFGALEETATDHSWMIDYAIVPNGLFPQIDPAKQADDFVKLVLEVHRNPRELRRRQEALNEIKELVGWDVTALQWKHHLYSKLGRYVQRGDFQRSNYFAAKYNKIFGRKTSGPELWTCPKLSKENKIVVISPFWNAAPYIQRCIESVAAQDYDNYIHYLIDDCSDDNSYQVAENYLKSLPESVREKFRLGRTGQRNGSAVANQITMIKGLNLDDDDIIVLLDGDDSLANRNDIFTYYNELHQNADFVYGSSWSMVDNIPLISQPYPPEIKEDKNYRNYKFNWGMPYTHLRTYKAKLVKNLSIDLFKDENGNWFKAGGDNSTFFFPLENCDPSRVLVNPDIVYNYNDVNPLNDYKINGAEQNVTAMQIVNRKSNMISEVKPQIVSQEPSEEIKERYRGFSKHPFLAPEHASYLFTMRGDGFNPKVIFDIGACVLNWTVEAKKTWPEAEVILFEGMPTAEFLYKENNLKYHIDVLSDRDNRQVDFYQNDHDPAGNSYYQENSAINPQAAIFYNDSYKKKVLTRSLDSIVNQRNFPQPDLIKMDIQGAELDVLKGAANVLANTKHMILELQNVEYNKGAPLKDEVINYLSSIGFDLISQFCNNVFDSDYHFINRKFMKKFEPIPSRNNTVNPAATQAPFSPARPKKQILIAIPNKNLIEAETFKSIYDLEVPDGYETTFQYFYGYQVEQVRNLIADWIVKGPYDYLFAVDADISFPPDTLKKMIAHNKDIVTGLYIQRIPGKHCIEVMRRNEHGGVTHVPWEQLKGQGLVEVDSCGFGCALIKKDVFTSIEYPHFVYKSALDHQYTISEDVYFCLKAKAQGKEIWADTSILCGHHGSWTFRVE